VICLVEVCLSVLIMIRCFMIYLFIGVVWFWIMKVLELCIDFL